MDRVNLRELFIKTADKMWTEIRCGNTDIDDALLILRGILEEANLEGEKIKIKFERK